jgi:hypothetical protein
MNSSRNRTNHGLLSHWTEASAYFLGLWLADGCITLHKSHGRLYKQVQFLSTDKELAVVVSDLLNGSIYAIQPRGISKKLKHQITVYSDEIFDNLYSFVHTTRKSQSSVALPPVPPKLFNHFVRGFFDGDGSVSIKHYKTRHGKLVDALQTSFTAGKDTGNFLERLRDEIRRHVPVGNKKICGGRTRKLIFNQYDSMLLCEWMYCNATLFLSRKKTIWNSCDKKRLARSRKWFSNKV